MIAPSRHGPTQQDPPRRSTLASAPGLLGGADACRPVVVSAAAGTAHALFVGRFLQAPRRRSVSTAPVSGEKWFMSPPTAPGEVDAAVRRGDRRLGENVSAGYALHGLVVPASWRRSPTETGEARRQWRPDGPARTARARLRSSPRTVDRVFLLSQTAVTWPTQNMDRLTAYPSSSSPALGMTALRAFRRSAASESSPSTALGSEGPRARPGGPSCTSRRTSNTYSIG